MKKNFFTNKNPKLGLSPILFLFCLLFANLALAQDTFTWTGTIDNNWATAGNWSKTGAGPDTYPGETVSVDLVEITNGGTPNIAVASTVNIARMTISNVSGPESGSVLTIDGTLKVESSTATVLTLAGGNIVNNGSLNVKSTFSGVPLAFVLGTAVVVPSVATEYGYSGLGNLNINIASGGGNNSAAIFLNANSLRTTYKMLFNSATTTFNLATNATFSTYAVRLAAAVGPNAPPLIIGGTGFNVGSAGTPVIGGLINVSATNVLTVNSGTSLNMYSLGTNISNIINLGNTLASNAAATPTRFTNKGTINILGTTSRYGINAAIASNAASTPIAINIINDGVINVDIVTNSASSGAYIGNNAFGTSPNNASNVLAFANITNNGTLTLKNSSVTTGGGQAINGSGAGQRTNTNFVNNGILNIEGSIVNTYQGFTINNNGVINTNSSFGAGAPFSNNALGTINFTKTPVRFTVLAAAAVTAGDIYTDSNGNEYIVRLTKVTGTGTLILCDATPSATIAVAPADLTKVSGAGDAVISYSAVSSIPDALNTTVASTTTISGTINTGKGSGSNLNTISAVNFAPTSTSVLSPGGTGNKGLINFSRTAATTLNGTLKMQVSGNTAAGIDYDKIVNTVASIGFDVTAATLDVTGISGVSTPVEIISTNGGTITGPFASVVGLTLGWSVDYSVVDKVQLVYSAIPANVTTWTGATNTSWTTAGNWSAGVPNTTFDVTIGAAVNQPIIASNVSINSLTINSTASVIVNSGFKLSVTDAIVNDGTLTIANNANLIQTNNVSNSGVGTTTVTRNSNLLSRSDYTIWSSPVFNQSLLAFSPATTTTRFHNYNETNNLYSEVILPGGTPFIAGSGYLIRMPNNAVTFPATQTFSGVFTGTLNNGNISKSVTYSGAAFGYNMVGNPYPSSIDADAFIAANSAKIESSLYFWRKINGASGSAYAVYNAMGSTATPSSSIPNGTIQVGQGFFVKAKSGATSIDFTNAMRLGTASTQFFKTGKQAQKDRLWLNLTNADNAFSQTLVGYTNDISATTGVDKFDAKYFNDSEIALTSNINGGEYTIQGRPAFDATDVVALNFKTDFDGSHTIALDRFDGVFATGQDVYLVDSKNAVETNLKLGSYTFNASIGEDNGRFSLKFQKTLKVYAPAFNESSVEVFTSNGSIQIKSGSVAISNVKVFDVQGRLITQKKNVNWVETSLNNLKTNKQVLIVKITGVDSTIVTKKIMY